MVANHALAPDAPESVLEKFYSPAEHVEAVDDRVENWNLIGLSDFLMDIARDHVSSQRENDLAILAR
jgi:hypothetical protein